MLPTSFFKAHGRHEQLPVGKPSPSGRGPQVSRVPLAPGDALVLRQMEVHRTDKLPLESHQWRLGIGFKVLELSPLMRLPLADSPFSHDYSTVRMLSPGLLPVLSKGRPFPDVYNDTALRKYRERPETAYTWVERTFEDNPQLSIVFAVPTLAMAAVALMARLQSRR